jgi:hypothetical protein
VQAASLGCLRHGRACPMPGLPRAGAREARTGDHAAAEAAAVYIRRQDHHGLVKGRTCV